MLTSKEFGKVKNRDINLLLKDNIANVNTLLRLMIDLLIDSDLISSLKTTDSYFPYFDSMISFDKIWRIRFFYCYHPKHFEPVYRYFEVFLFLTIPKRLLNYFFFPRRDLFIVLELFKSEKKIKSTWDFKHCVPWKFTIRGSV